MNDMQEVMVARLTTDLLNYVTPHYGVDLALTILEWMQDYNITLVQQSQTNTSDTI